MKAHQVFFWLTILTSMAFVVTRLSFLFGIVGEDKQLYSLAIGIGAILLGIISVYLKIPPLPPSSSR